MRSTFGYNPSILTRSISCFG